MNPRVINVIPNKDYTLNIKFENGEEKIFDIRHLLNFGVFKELKDLSYFKKVRPFMGTISWPHGQDICPDTLYIDGKDIK